MVVKLPGDVPHVLGKDLLVAFRVLNALAHRRLPAHEVPECVSQIHVLQPWSRRYSGRNLFSTKKGGGVIRMMLHAVAKKGGGGVKEEMLGRSGVFCHGVRLLDVLLGPPSPTPAPLAATAGLVQQLCRWG